MAIAPPSNHENPPSPLFSKGVISFLCKGEVGRGLKKAIFEAI